MKRLSRFIARIGELEPCTYVDGVMVMFHRIDKAFRDAEGCL